MQAAVEAAKQGEVVKWAETVKQSVAASENVWQSQRNGEQEALIKDHVQLIAQLRDQCNGLIGEKKAEITALQKELADQRQRFTTRITQLEQANDAAKQARIVAEQDRARLQTASIAFQQQLERLLKAGTDLHGLLHSAPEVVNNPLPSQQDLPRVYRRLSL